MTKASKNLKIVVSLILLVLAFFGCFKITFAYFSASAKSDGDLDFYNLDVRFVYRKAGVSGNLPKDEPTNKYTINLMPVGGASISRGEAFALAEADSGTAIDSLYIELTTGSCECYVRFWIDAFIVDEHGVVDETVNYGKYFLLVDHVSYTKTGSTVEGSWTYFVKDRMRENYMPSVTLGNTLTLSDLTDAQGGLISEVPLELLGSSLKLSMTLEAVQAEHGAVSKVFGKAGDTRGYYSSWS